MARLPAEAICRNCRREMRVAWSGHWLHSEDGGLGDCPEPVPMTEDERRAHEGKVERLRGATFGLGSRTGRSQPAPRLGKRG